MGVRVKQRGDSDNIHEVEGASGAGNDQPQRTRTTLYILHRNKKPEQPEMQLRNSNVAPGRALPSPVEGNADKKDPDVRSGKLRSDPES